MLTTRTTRPLKSLALALALAALAVPTAQGKGTPAVKYVPPDPWAHNLIHQTAQSVPLITEHSAGQNGTGQRSTAQSVPLITEHSAGQNSQPKAAGRYEAVSVSAAAPNGFKWRDAGVGASVAFAAMLLAVGGATLIVRRGRGRLAGF